MDRLWSPWRYRYIQSNAANSASAPGQCALCEIAAAENDAGNYVLRRGRLNFALLNLYPYTGGHLMIAPYRHVALLEDADEDTAREMMLLAREAQRRLREVYGAPGFNLGMNLGECAGAGIAGHIHMHVLPRWPGDANFMTTVGETRVLPEELGETYRRLKAGWAP